MVAIMSCDIRFICNDPLCRNTTHCTEDVGHEGLHRRVYAGIHGQREQCQGQRFVMVFLDCPSEEHYHGLKNHPASSARCAIQDNGVM